MSKTRIPSKIELTIRSIVFWILSILWLSLVVTVELLALPFSVKIRSKIAASWAKGTISLLKWICNVDYKIEGLDNIPDGAAIVMANHQSTWETLIFQKILPSQLWVVKKELLKVPVFGWGLALCEPIAVDRNSGRKAVDQVVTQGKEKLEQGRWIIIFPQGTRISPGERAKYKIGGAFLASKVDYPVLPIAHNAGEYWPKHSLIKWPGTITVSIGPVINGYGREPGEIRNEVEEWIENKVAEITNPANWSR